MRQEIINILKHPYPLDSAQVEKLEQLIEIYPYFQPIYFALLKHYKHKDYFSYSNLLNKCIFHITNRELLYNFVHFNIDEYFHELIFEKDGVVKHTTELTNTQQNNFTKTDEIPFTDRREKETLQEAIAETMFANTQEENIEELEKSLLPKIDFELDENFEIIKPTDEEISLTNLAKTIEQNSKTNAEDEPIIEIEAESTIETGKATTLVENQSPSIELNEENNRGDNANSFMPPKTKEQINIIDKFLEELPNIKPQPIDPKVPQNDISVESVVEHEDFMTETLAKIFTKQGNYDKAIEIYKKLILKFPEKNTYFASQINELEKLKK